MRRFPSPKRGSGSCGGWILTAPPTRSRRPCGCAADSIRDALQAGLRRAGRQALRACARSSDKRRGSAGADHPADPSRHDPRTSKVDGADREHASARRSRERKFARAVRSRGRPAHPHHADRARQKRNRSCVVSLHHIVSDGWSMGVLVDEIWQPVCVRPLRGASAVTARASRPIHRLRRMAAPLDRVRPRASASSPIGSTRLGDAAAPAAAAFRSPRGRPEPDSRGASHTVGRSIPALVDALRRMARRSRRRRLFVTLLLGFKMPPASLYGPDRHPDRRAGGQSQPGRNPRDDRPLRQHAQVLRTRASKVATSTGRSSRPPPCNGARGPGQPGRALRALGGGTASGALA